MNLIASYWETERLFVRDAVLENDLARLQTLWESTAYLGEFDGHKERSENDIYHELTEGDLPPGGSERFFKIQPFFSKETSEMLGYITMYHGYPNDGTVWITFFYVNKNQQGQGYGHEVMRKFAEEAEKAGYQRLSLTVALKNWEAIRFWTKAGFNKVTGFHGDRVYGKHSFANLSLEKDLDDN